MDLYEGSFSFKGPCIIVSTVSGVPTPPSSTEDLLIGFWGVSLYSGRTGEQTTGLVDTVTPRTPSVVSSSSSNPWSVPHLDTQGRTTLLTRSPDTEILRTFSYSVLPNPCFTGISLVLPGRPNGTGSYLPVQNLSPPSKTPKTYS